MNLTPEHWASTAGLLKLPGVSDFLRRWPASDPEFCPCLGQSGADDVQVSRGLHVLGAGAKPRVCFVLHLLDLALRNDNGHVAM